MSKISNVTSSRVCIGRPRGIVVRQSTDAVALGRAERCAEPGAAVEVSTSSGSSATKCDGSQVAPSSLRTRPMNARFVPATST